MYGIALSSLLFDMLTKIKDSVTRFLENFLKTFAYEINFLIVFKYS